MAGLAGAMSLQLSMAAAQSPSPVIPAHWLPLRLSQALSAVEIPREQATLAEVLSSRGTATRSESSLATAGEAAPYVDRLMVPGGPAPRDDDDVDEPDRDGSPRAIRIELQLARTLNNGNAINGGAGLATRAAVDTQNFGSLSFEMQTGANAQFGTDNGSAGALRPFMFTLQQYGLPLAGGWSANNALGIVPPVQVGLTRQQPRFSLPSRTVEGVTTELLSTRGAASDTLNVTLGDVGLVEGFPISGFRRQSGRLFQTGAQWRSSSPDGWLARWLGTQSHLTSAVAYVNVRGAPDLLGPGGLVAGSQPGNVPTANHESLFIAQRVERDGVSIQANAIRSMSTSSAVAQNGNGGWVDAGADYGRLRHSAGLFRLGSGLNWGGLAVNNDVQGGYYRMQYQTLRWSGDVAVEALRSVSGVSAPGQFATGNLRYQLSRDISFGGGASVRTYGGTASQAFAYVQSANSLGSSRAQIDIADANTGERSQGITLDQNWNALGSVRLSTSLTYAHQVASSAAQAGTPSQTSSKRDSASLALNASGDVLDDFTLNTNVQSRYTISGAVDDALYATVGLTWRYNRAWSVSANATAGTGRYDSGVVSLDPLAAPVTTLARPSQRTYLLVLRYEDRAGTVIAPLGGRVGSGGGELAGYLYFDANANGIRDANEAGVPSVTVVLDGKFSTRTNQQGRFEFPFVGAGEHTLSVVSDNLPLPWSLINDGITTVTVSPRQNAQVNIPAVRTL